MATWIKGDNAGQTARNRKLPSDAVIRQNYYDDGMTIATMSRLYGVDTTQVHQLFRLRGWPKLARPEPVEAPSATLSETAEKIVCKRLAFRPGKGHEIIEILISLPRIPTLHGHFAGV